MGNIFSSIAQSLSGSARHGHILFTSITEDEKETKTTYILRLRKSKLEFFVIPNEEIGHG